MTPSVSRRSFLYSSVGAVAAVPFAVPAAAKYSPASDDFPYEIQKPESEWRTQLGDDAYAILRDGGTEKPKTNDFWKSTEKGTYHCRGCDLHVFSSKWWVPLDIGFVFFTHGELNSNLLGMDRPEVPYPESASDTELLDSLAQVETHCRRCGGHLGHIVSINRKVLHCINGASLTFKSASA